MSVSDSSVLSSFARWWKGDTRAVRRPGGQKADVQGWWFSGPDSVLWVGDEKRAEAGATHETAGIPVVEECGLHGSVEALDALGYAPRSEGLVAWRVALSGWVVRGDGIVAATRRTYLSAREADPVLRKFARLCALDVVGLWGCPSQVLQFLETGEEGARAAAVNAAAGAAKKAAEAGNLASAFAARAVVCAAAEDAAGSVALSTSETAEWALGRAGEGDALRGKQSRTLHGLLMEVGR